MFIDAAVATLPVVLLIYLMTRKKSMPAHHALPLVAVILYLLRLFYFRTDATLANASVINGLLTAWQPILIIWGAIFLFKTMDNSGAMETVSTWLKNNARTKVAQLMAVGWAFSFLMEGVSGFGTPAALAAPILVGMGFNPVRVVALTLAMNSMPVAFGAVGTPTWFGLGQLELTRSDLLVIGFRTALIHSVAALIIPIMALMFVVSWREVRRNLGFIYISIAACIVPYLIFAHFDYEFPSIVGGFVGLLITVLAARHGIGLGKDDLEQEEIHPVAASSLLKASFPIWGSILLLMITRVQHLGIRELITAAEPAWRVSFGPLGDFGITRWLVLSLENILGVEGPDGRWTHSLLYVPSLIPFFAISFLSFRIFGMNRQTSWATWNETFNRVKSPIAALLGALVLVRLLLAGGDQSPVMMIGTALADLIGLQWMFFAAYLGAIGSFFSGSNTVSNLTFAGIQVSIADSLALNRNTILSLQHVGAGMGNMVCINNIVAVCSVLGLVREEGNIIKRTTVPVIIYGIIVALVALLF